ncbi:MAG: hypothetical protein ACE5QF_01765 [Thermoplasmata archaeon]
MTHRGLDKDLVIVEGIEAINQNLSILIRLVVILLIIVVSSVIWFLA